MGLLAWVMMGIALWHFTIWLPDRYWGGIVGAFIGALFGAVLFGWAVNGFTIPGRHDDSHRHGAGGDPGRAHRYRPVLPDRRATSARPRAPSWACRLAAMGLLDLAFAPLRAAFSSAEHEVVEEVHEVESIQRRVLDVTEVIRDATESIEAHVEMIDMLATSISPLTESVNRLTEQMAELNKVLAPMAGVEREVSRFEHLFHRHRSDAEPPADSPPDATAPPTG